MGWLPDSKSKGTGFDSRSCRGHFFTFLGMSWDVFGSAFGRFSDGPGKKEISKIGMIFQKWTDFPKMDGFSQNGLIFQKWADFQKMGPYSIYFIYYFNY